MINPLTGRSIKYGGPTHKKLFKYNQIGAGGHDDDNHPEEDIDEASREYLEGEFLDSLPYIDDVVRQEIDMWLRKNKGSREQARQIMFNIRKRLAHKLKDEGNLEDAIRMYPRHTWNNDDSCTWDYVSVDTPKQEKKKAYENFLKQRQDELDFGIPEVDVRERYSHSCWNNPRNQGISRESHDTFDSRVRR